MLIDILSYYWNYFIEKIPVFSLSLVVFLISWLIARTGRFISLKIVDKLKDKGKIELVIVFGRLLRAGILILGLILALSVAGVKLSALITSLGLVGFALSFALQDYIKNFLAGVVMMAQRRFVIGDEIEIGEFKGIIKAIEIRFTIIRTFDNEEILIPNAEVMNRAVVRKTAHSKRRSKIEITLEYTLELKKIFRELIEVVRKIDGVHDDPKPEIYFGSIDDDKVTLSLYYWVEPRKYDREIIRSKILDKTYQFCRDKKIQKLKII